MKRLRPKITRSIATFSIAMALLIVTCGGPAIRSTVAADLAVAGDRIESESDEAHTLHRAMQRVAKRYQLSEKSYLTPDVSLIRMTGKTVSLREELSHDQPVILSFIFTSCTTICPVLTATLAQAEKQLINEPVVPRIVSVSIDPEYDTPERLQSYASSYRTGPDWIFLTGDRKSIIEVQRAFDAYRGDKMNHIPLTLLRGTGDETWVRLEGFTTAADLVHEYRELWY
jgi:protein SCO1/2